QNADYYTYFNMRPVALVEGGRFDSGDLSGVLLTRARPYDVPTVTFRALSGAARIARHRAIEPFAGFTEATVRSVDGRPLPIQVAGAHVLAEVAAPFTITPGALQGVA